MESTKPCQAQETLVRQITNGRFSIDLEFRQLAEDRGLSIHIYGPTPTGEQELLRFDCFDKEPHYHIAWSARNDPFIPISSDDPFEWAIGKLKRDSQSLLSQADALPMSDEERSDWNSALTKVYQLGNSVA